jgi:hypothetical protein
MPGRKPGGSQATVARGMSSATPCTCGLRRSAGAGVITWDRGAERPGRSSRNGMPSPRAASRRSSRPGRGVRRAAESE